MKSFKKLKGTRVLLSLPQIPESNIYLTEEVKKSMVEQEKMKLMKLSVYAVGENVSDIKEGDVVLVDDNALARAPIINLDEETNVAMISSFDIILIW